MHPEEASQAALQPSPMEEPSALPLPCAPSGSAPLAKVLRIWRYGWRVPLLIAHLLLGILVCGGILIWQRQAVMRGPHEPLAQRIIRGWSKGLLRIFSLRVRTFGQPLTEPVLFVANHTSWLDIEILHTQRAACFVAKAEIERWPLIGWLSSSAGTIFHRRGNHHSLATVMHIMVQRLQSGRSVAVFPEGGIGYHGVLRLFHARVLQTALDADVPVQPVALRFSRHGRREIGAGFLDDRESFLDNALRLLGEQAMDAEIHFLPAVPALPEARRRMAELAREAIAKALEDSPA